MDIEQSLRVNYATKLRHIQSLLARSQEFDKEFYSVKKAGLEIDVFKNVFSPAYFDDSEYFAAKLQSVQSVEGLTVLEIGTGTGLIALKFALGKARQVVATDINGDAIRNARHNVARHRMESIIDLRKGYIFRPVKDRRFDLIFWNVPFCYLDVNIKHEIGIDETINELQKSVFNPYYAYLNDYLNEGFDYLNENGRLLLGFSPTIGRADYLDDMSSGLELVKIVLHEEEINIEGSNEVLQILEFKKKQ